MRIDVLTVTAFGPFLDRRFEFAPGLTLVYGANEAGKSSMQAALYAALCGVRRGRGRSTAEHEFDRYRPWHRADAWRVAVRLHLADGRRVEIDQDLDDKPRSRAFDVDLGREVTDEILPRDGTPDATLWLGLDRRAFAATSCIRQAEVLAVRAAPHVLREHLQRAAATSGADATAAEAIDRINAFLREHVGGKQVNSVRPLRRTMDRVDAARAALAAARDEHRAYVELLERDDRLEEARRQCARDEALVRAARAQSHARARRRDLERARELRARHPEGAPASLVADDDRVREVDAALLRHDAPVRTVELVGRPAVILRRELEALDHELEVLGAEPLSTTHTGAVGSPVPVVPSSERVDRAIVGRIERLEERIEAREGMSRPAGGTQENRHGEPVGRHDAALREAVEALHVARRMIAEHAEHRPPEPGTAVAAGARADELRALAEMLSHPEPRVDAGLAARHDDLERRLVGRARRQRRFRRAALGLAVVALVVFAASAVAPHDLQASTGAWRAVAAALLAVAGGLALARSPGRDADTRRALHETEAALLEQRLRHDDWQEERDRAEAASRGYGLDPEPATLRLRADELQQWEHRRDRLAMWEETQGSLHAQRVQRESVLRRALEARGIAAGDDVLVDAERWMRIGDLQVRRGDLEALLVRRERDEEDASRAHLAHRAAEDELVTMARAVGLEAADAPAARRALLAWRESRRQALRSHEQAIREWTELERLCAGGSLEDLERQVERLEDRARSESAPFAPEALAAVDGGEAMLAARETARRDAESALERLRVEIQLRARTVPRIAELEETLRDAELELERVQRLEATLLATRELLHRAQDRVHRSIAPLLATAVRERLAPATAGRYDDVQVDPENLAVRVRERDGEWRDAGLVSHGTSEQIYLRLRIAMSQHLVREGESSPLLLDDVTVQFDRDRKRAMLDELLRTSAAQQVVLWSQEDEVLAWARERLQPPRDALVILEPLPRGR